MSEPYIGEIRPFAFGYQNIPTGWITCQGQILSIAAYQELFVVLGYTYGGEPNYTFALPDLRSRTAIGFGSGAELGDKGGVETVSLSESTMPTHTHALYASTEISTTNEYEGNVLAGSTKTYSAATPNGEMIDGTLGTVGGEKVHENMQPFLALNFCICLVGQMPKSD